MFPIRIFVLWTIICSKTAGLNFPSEFIEELGYEQILVKDIISVDRFFITFLSHVRKAARYNSYVFPLREDGTSTQFSDEYSYDTDFNINVMGTQSVSIPVPSIYADVKLPSDILDAAAVFNMANPAYRRTERPTMCFNYDIQDYMGLRLLQTYVPYGMPFEVPCFSCSKQPAGMLTSFHLLPERDFIVRYPYHRLHNRLEKIPGLYGKEALIPDEYRQAPFNALFFKFMATFVDDVVDNADNSKYNIHNDSLQMVYHANIASGSHTLSSTYQYLKDGTGKLQVHPHIKLLQIMKSRDKLIKEVGPKSVFYESLVHQKKIFDELMVNGWSFMCAESVDGTPKDTGFVINIDTVTNPNDESFKYQHIESKTATPAPVLDDNANAQLKVVWDEWSCCSACCCSGEICGIFATKKCNDVYSSQFRKGYLSLLKINQTKEMKIPQLGSLEEEFNVLLDISPYKEKGIAVFSSMLRYGRFKAVWDFITPLLQKQLGKTYDGIGMYVEELSCKMNPQKANCTLLAECLQLSTDIETNEEETVEKIDDPCETEEIITLTISEKISTFRVELGQSYRIKVDEQVFEMTAAHVKWKVSMKTAPKYDSTKGCLEQGIAVHFFGKDLLVTKITSSDINKRIEATLDDGSKVAARLVDNSEKESGTSTRTIVIWSCGIAAFIVALLTFIIVIHKMRVRRVDRILQNKESRELEEEEEEGEDEEEDLKNK